MRDKVVLWILWIGLGLWLGLGARLARPLGLGLKTRLADAWLPTFATTAYLEAPYADLHSCYQKWLRFHEEIPDYLHSPLPLS